jgi:hypothetical protein
VIEGDPFPWWFLGNEDACDFAHTIWNVCQGWDDVIDEGKSAAANDIFQWIMFKKESHPFYRVHGAVLSPVMLVVFLQWQAANDLERGSDDDVNKAYMLRAGIYSLFVTMAWIVGGNEWAAKIGPEIYRTYGETLSDFRKEMQICRGQ